MGEPGVIRYKYSDWFAATRFNSFGDIKKQANSNW
jgi:hypothetical protein